MFAKGNWLQEHLLNWHTFPNIISVNETISVTFIQLNLNVSDNCNVSKLR